MSVKKLSIKLKEGIVRGFHKISNTDESLSNKEPIPMIMANGCQSRKSNVWHVLITGGAGHLAEHLVNALVENVRNDLRPDAVTKVEMNAPVEHRERAESISGIGTRLRKHLLQSKINAEIERRLPEFIEITLVDLVVPNHRITSTGYTNFVEASFADEKIMKSALESVNTVFHLAAVGMTGQYAHDRKACMDINAIGTMNLLTWAKDAGVRRFIYSSSIGVIFDGSPLKNVKESTVYPECYYNYYCESKAHAESIVLKASTNEMKTTVLRFNGIYGAGEKRVTERVVSFMTSGWWIATCKPNGIEALTQLSSVDNCVQGLLKSEMALRVADSPHGQVYNIMDGTPVGTFSFWSPLHRAFGFENEMWNIPVTLFRPIAYISQVVSNFLKVDPALTLLEADLLIIDTTFSLEKARRELEYEPSPAPMEEMIEMYTKEAPRRFHKAEKDLSYFKRLPVVICAFLLVFMLLLWLLLSATSFILSVPSYLIS